MANKSRCISLMILLYFRNNEVKKKMNHPPQRGSESRAKEERHLEKYTTAQFFRLTADMARLTVKSFWRRHKISSRVIALFLLFIMIFSIWAENKL